MSWTLFLLLCRVLPVANTFPLAPSASATAGNRAASTGTLQQQSTTQWNNRVVKKRCPSSLDVTTKKKLKCSRRCPDPLDDDDDTEEQDMDMEDRREAAFAMLGSLWAMTTTITSFPQMASAAYGTDAKMEFPNVVEGMSRRTNEQCLVESLGSRQCLVYLDPANKLYQQADAQVLLQRIDNASTSLTTIPALVERKKWSQVSGVLTGPLGNLVVTMQQLANLSENPTQAMTMAKRVKGDIIEIGQASDRKQGDKALSFHQKATDDLVAFVKSL